MCTPSHKSGFTLIELLVTIAIISILMSIVLAMLTGARERTRHVRAVTDLNQIRIAFEFYFNAHNAYPPAFQEHCDMCWWIPAELPWAIGTWEEVMDGLVTEKFFSAPLLLDPWGTIYGYDQNYATACWNAWSLVCSAGPNKTFETNQCQQASIMGGDDICIFFPDND